MQERRMKKDHRGYGHTAKMQVKEVSLGAVNEVQWTENKASEHEPQGINEQGNG